MFVLCPHCQFLVAVDPVTGQPPAHCPRCDGALAPPPAATAAADDVPAVADDESTVDAIPTPGTEPAMLEPVAAPTPEVVEEDADPAAIAMPDEATADEPAATTQAPAASRKGAPDVALAPTAGAAARPDRRWRMPAAIAALAMLLALQMLLADRTRLAADARWRPTLTVLCGVLRCDLPPWHEPTAFTLSDRDVRPDPRRPGVLHVSARFRNDAAWPQAWPQVLLTLSDVDGRVAGARLFSPREYGAGLPTQKPIASGQVADIAMDVIEPAPDIVAFTFDFR